MVIRTNVIQSIENGIQTAALDPQTYKSAVKNKAVYPRKRSYREEFSALGKLVGRKPAISVFGMSLHSWCVLNYKSKLYLCGSATRRTGMAYYIFNQQCKEVFEYVSAKPQADYTKEQFYKILQSKT
ncbi:MAG: hypothetical protein M0R51_11530 [Clostridia bacterium]|jgi:hypothetical protein|nr:hypothetical protein [Clostridia bacterium]